MLRTVLLAALLTGLSATAMATDRGSSGYVPVDYRGQHGRDYRGDRRGHRYDGRRYSGRDHYRFGDRYRGERWDRGYRGSRHYHPGHRYYGPRYYPKYYGPRYYGPGYRKPRNYYYGPRYYGSRYYYRDYYRDFGVSICGYDRNLSICIGN
jgi:hypothetical protein